MKRWVLKVERQHRLRLPARLIESLEWLSKSDVTIKATAYFGENGQLCVLAPGSRSDAGHIKLTEQLKAAINAEESSKELLVLGRHIADSVTLTFSKEKHRVSLVFPEELRLLGCAPSAGEVAVVFFWRETLEIWPATDWRNHLQAVRGNLDRLVEDLLADLTDRNG
jgi:hypothetical protein